jgi:hypothetical protein
VHHYQTFEEAQARLQTFLEESTMPNASTHPWSMYLPMSLKRNTSCASLEVVWILGGTPPNAEVSIGLIRG